MNKLEQLKKLKPIFIVFGLVLTAAIIFAVYTAIKKGAVPPKIPPPTVLLPPNIAKPTIRNVSFQLKQMTVPPIVKVYKVSSYSLSEPKAYEIAKSLDLTASPRTSSDKQGNTTLFWKNTDSTKNLSISLNAGYVEYIYTFEPYKVEIGQPPLPTISDQKQAITIATDFLTSHKLYPSDIEPQSKVVMLIKNFDAEPTDKFSQAYYFQVNFLRKIDSLTVYQQLSVNTTITTLVDKYKNVARVSYQYPTIFESTPREFTPISLDTAEEAIRKGAGTIVNFAPGTTDIKSSETMDSAIINEAEIAYLDDRKSGFIQPIYIFRGEAAYKNNIKEPIVIYLPAINQ